MNLEFNNALTDSVLMALDFNGAKGINVLHVVDVVDVVAVVVVTGGVEVNGKVVSMTVVICWVVLNVIPSVVLVVVSSSVRLEVSGSSVVTVLGVRVVEVKISALSLISETTPERVGKNWGIYFSPPSLKYSFNYYD